MTVAATLSKLPAPMWSHNSPYLKGSLFRLLEYVSITWIYGNNWSFLYFRPWLLPDLCQFNCITKKVIAGTSAKVDVDSIYFYWRVALPSSIRHFHPWACYRSDATSFIIAGLGSSTVTVWPYVGLLDLPSLPTKRLVIYESLPISL